MTKRYQDMTRDELIAMLEQQGEQEAETNDYPYEIGDKIDLNMGQGVVKRYYTEDNRHKVQLYLYQWMDRDQTIPSKEYTLMSMPVRYVGYYAEEHKRDKAKRQQHNKRG